MQSPSDLVSIGTGNATVTWLLVAALVADVFASLYLGQLIWAVFALAVLVVAVAPAIARSDPRTVVAWQALALCALPMWARTLDVYAQPMGHVALAALALLVVVELEAFTVVEMPGWFAVLFVVVTTIAVASLWGIVQYAADLALGTAFFEDTADLMWDLVLATAVGAAASVVFEVYFSQRELLGAVEDGIES